MKREKWFAIKNRGARSGGDPFLLFSFLGFCLISEFQNPPSFKKGSLPVLLLLTFPLPLLVIILSFIAFFNPFCMWVHVIRFDLSSSDSCFLLFQSLFWVILFVPPVFFLVNLTRIFHGGLSFHQIVVVLILLIAFLFERSVLMKMNLDDFCF